MTTRVGDSVGQIETPALVVDLDALERNIARMATFARSRGVKLRPHAKTHKSAAIAKLQIAAGAVGVCVQKLAEAEALAAQGIADLFITNEIVDPAKLARVAALAKRVTLAIAVDSALGVERLARALKDAGSRLGVFIEVDVGQGRCGVAPAAAGALAHQVVSHGLELAGLQAYHGGAQHLRTADGRESEIRHAVSLARTAQASITAGGIACPLVTGAGTGTFPFEAASGLYGELQAGSYVFMDRDYADNQPGSSLVPQFEHALFVRSQVISRGSAHAVIDAGHKSHAIDSGPPRVHGADLLFTNGGDEHGILTAPRSPDTAIGPPRGSGPAWEWPGARPASVLPALGDTVWLIPGHCDPTVNLHDRYVCVRGGLAAGHVEALWPVDARGALA